jgi:hypothetical protein
MVDFFFLENHAICEIRWIKTLETDRLQMTVFRISIACGVLNLLKTKRTRLYLNTQFVPRSKHFSSRL